MNRYARTAAAGVIAGVITCVVASTGWAQPAGHPPMGKGGMQGSGGHSGMGGMFSPSYLKDQLKLSDDQIQKFKKLRNDYEKESIKRGADIKIAELELWELMEKKDLTADQLEKKVREVEGKKTDLRVYRFRHLMGLKSILSPEQFEQFRSMGMMMFGGGGRYGMGMQGGKGMGGHPGMGYGGKGHGAGGYGYDHGSDED